MVTVPEERLTSTCALDDVFASSPRGTVKAFILTSCTEDFEMKRAMINIACLVAEEETCMSQITSHSVFLGALLLHLDRNIHAPSATHEKVASLSLDEWCRAGGQRSATGCCAVILAAHAVQ